MATQCSAQIWSTATFFGKYKPCGRTARFQDGKGNWFCGLHSPEAVAKREAKSDKIFQEKQVKFLKSRAYDGLLREVEAWRSKFPKYEYRESDGCIRQIGECVKSSPTKDHKRRVR